MPPRFSVEQSHRSPRDFGAQVEEVLALLRGAFRSAGGADMQVWISGSGDDTAQVAGVNGLPFAARYHVSPATVLGATDAYRAAFRPSAYLDRPYVSVVADVVVAPSGAEARELATIRTGVDAGSTRGSRETRDRSRTGWNSSATPPAPTS